MNQQLGFRLTIAPQRVVLHHSAPETAATRLLSICDAEGLLTVVLGQLYYEADLPGLAANGRELSAAELVAQLYRSHGAAGLTKLEGDFAVVVCDRRRGEIVAQRDPFGGFPVFWLQDRDSAGDRRLRIASSLDWLLDSGEQRRVDMQFVADFLVVAGPTIERRGEHTVYENVRRVVAGDQSFWSMTDFAARSRTYWSWEPEEIRSRSLAEIAEQYREQLSRAVRERMRGRVVAHYSGGMDSTAIALLARDQLAAQHQTTLPAISLAYRRLSWLENERKYLEPAWNEAGLEVHAINGDELLDFDSFRDPPPHDEPYVALWRLAMDRATIDCAARCGADTLLTGLGADELLDRQPFHLADMLQGGRFLAAWLEACRWAKADHVSPFGMLQQFGFSSACESGWLRLLQPFLPSTSAAPLLQAERHGGTPWIRTNFVRRFQLDRKIKTERVERFHHSTSTAMSFALSSLASRVGDVARWSLGVPAGVMITHPFLDPRVIRLALGAMEALPPDPNRMKPLLAEAMRGTLPESIRTRRRKGHFNEVYYRGLTRNADALQDLLAHPAVRELDFLDLGPLRETIKLGAIGGVGVRPLHQLNLTLSFLRWYVMQAEQPATSFPRGLARVDADHAVVRRG